LNVSAPRISVLLAAREERASFVMPDLVGHGEDDAVSEIVGAGLRVGRIASQELPPATDSNTPETIPSSTRTVVRTTPSAGQRVYEGQAIGLEVTR
jgi:beta-lactam-binding protein with PASTA domain